MKVMEFIEKINAQDCDLENVLEIKKYLPIAMKKAIAQSIIYECTDDLDGTVKIDSVQRYLSYVKYMITYHTNLEYTDEDYDTISSIAYGRTNLLDAIINCFEYDAKECKKILNYMVDDYKRENGLESALIKFFDKAIIVMSDVSNKLTQNAEGFDMQNMLPDNVDKEKLSSFLKNYIK